MGAAQIQLWKQIHPVLPKPRPHPHLFPHSIHFLYTRIYARVCAAPRL